MTEPDINIIFSEAEEKDAAEFLHEKIREFNNEHSIHHRASREPGAFRPLFLLLKDGAGCLIGGLAGSTCWGWLTIDQFFIPQELRGRDLGSKLLSMAEEIARERGCKHVTLTTFNYQAPRFYEKMGYEEVGRLEDYPPGATYFWMRKDFHSSSPPGGNKPRNDLG